jgi:hypothetical protein
MAKSVVFSTFPRTKPPPEFILGIVDVFDRHADAVGTRTLPKGLTSDQVMAVLCDDLCALGFKIEKGKTAASKIKRPVFFGENGQPARQYEIDGFHVDWSCGIEIEAGRAWMGNAIYRDLIQAMVMVDLETLVLAVPVNYRYQSGGRTTISKDYENTVSVADALYGHTRITMPYRLAVIGY